VYDNITRRGFLKGVSGLFLAATAPVLLPEEPRIWALGTWERPSRAELHQYETVWRHVSEREWIVVEASDGARFQVGTMLWLPEPGMNAIPTVRGLGGVIQ
jgi:hypothetical protein